MVPPRQHHAEDDGRDDELSQVAERILDEGNEPQGRHVPEPQRSEHHYQDPDPEVGNGDERHRNAACDIVTDRVLAQGRIHADRHRNQQAQDQAHQAQFDGNRQPAFQRLQHRHPGPQRGADVALQHPVEPGVPAPRVRRCIVLRNDAQPTAVLDVDWCIESQVTPYRRPGLFRHAGLRPHHHHVHDVARDEANRQEHDDARNEQRGYGEQQSSDQVDTHADSSNDQTHCKEGARRAAPPLLNQGLLFVTNAA